jgi:hypothetical protein
VGTVWPVRASEPPPAGDWLPVVLAPSRSLANCDYTPEVLQAAEHALDNPASRIEHEREAALTEPISFGRDVGPSAVCLDPGNSEHGIGVVALKGRTTPADDELSSLVLFLNKTVY